MSRARSLPAFAAASLLAAAAALAAPAPAPAQAPADSAPAARDTFTLEEVVVTAHRTPVPRDQLTGSVTVLDSARLSASLAGDVSDLLRSVPGAHVARAGSYGATTSLFLRGGESDFVQVLVDGVPLNRPGGAVDLADLSADGVERIEVVRGPSSVLYGSDAATGVVQVFTRRGRGSPRGAASVQGGTHGTLDWQMRSSGGASWLGYSASVSRRTTEGLYELNNDYRNLTGTARLDLRAGPDTEAGLSVRYGDSEYHVPTNSAGVPVDANAVQNRETLTAGLDLTRALADRLKAHLLLAVHEIDFGFDDRPDGPADTLGFYASELRQDLRRRSADARLTYRPDRGTALTAGVELEREEEQSVSESRSSFGTSRSSVDRARDNVGYYLEGLTRIGERLSLTAGGRLDDNETFGTFGTYQLGVAYRLPTDTKLRASVRSAFREPSFVENFGSPPFRGNQALDPEEVRSWEVGLRQELAEGRLSVRVAAFRQSFEDLIQFTFSPPQSGGPNFFNVAAAESRGLETEVEARLGAGLRLRGHLTLLGTEVTDPGFDSEPGDAFVEGERLLRRPGHSLEGELRYRRSGLGSAWLRVSGVGQRPDRDFGTAPPTRVTLPGYVRVDAALRLRALRAASGVPVVPTLRVENLLDDDYEEARNFPAPGRTVVAGLQVRVGG